MKISIVGRGNAGCISAMHFAHYRNFLNTKIELELLFDSKIPPVPTGQGTTLEFPQLLFETFNSGYLNKFPTTMKTGIMYENFGTKQDKIFHHFPVGRYSLHFEPKQFQDFVCNNLKVNFKEIDENITNYNQIDSDYIIDCRGTPKDFTDYDTLNNPLNCALLASLPKKENDVKYTRSIAHKNGWCFYIPLPDKTSLGYIFNKDLTSIEDAKKDFMKSFGVEKINKVFPFSQYVAKEPIIDNRVFLNGNKLFFLEPLEATAMGTYINATRFYYDFIFNNVNKKETVFKVKDYINKVQDFILWHYSTGSKYDTIFWRYGKDLWDKHEKIHIEKTIKIVRGMSNLDIEKSRNSNFQYAQWQEWNFDNWIKGTE
jgi:hypothetical protein